MTKIFALEEEHDIGLSERELWRMKGRNKYGCHQINMAIVSAFTL